MDPEISDLLRRRFSFLNQSIKNNFTDMDAANLVASHCQLFDTITINYPPFVFLFFLFEETTSLTTLTSLPSLTSLSSLNSRPPRPPLL
jgi:hypothetical protein